VSDLLFVSWAPFCSRSDNIARELGGRSVMIYHAFWGSNYATVLFKYLSQSIATCWVLLKVRPRRVYVMSPPAVACLPVWIYSKLFRAGYVVDAHTAAFVDARWRALEFVTRFFARHAVTTLVTNTHWQSKVRSWGARCDIVTDVRVQFPQAQPVDLPPGAKIAVVCTFTFDEPIATMFEAAALVPEVSFHFTGSWKRLAPEILAHKPPNVRLMGFLPDAQYVGLLKQCTAVMSLTTLDHTMQRGAYEAAYLARPIITSNFELLRESFPRATVFVDGTPESIAAGVRRMCADTERYSREAIELDRDKRRTWERVREQLMELS
jgi:hypothetical protein